MVQAPDPAFVLNASTLAAVGAVLGSMAGAVTYLGKRLYEDKQRQIEDLRTELEAERAISEELRQRLWAMLENGERLAATAEQATTLAVRSARARAGRR